MIVKTMPKTLKIVYKCHKCGDKSYENNTEKCSELGNGYYCYSCIDRHLEAQLDYYRSFE